MTLFSSKFNVVTNNPHPNAQAGLLMILDAAAPGGVDSEGTPVAGVLAPGLFVSMDSAGKAELAESPDLNAARPVLMFVVVDGDTDYDGAFVTKVTCVHGGARIRTDQYVAGTYTVGQPVKVGSGGSAANDGKIAPMESGSDYDQMVGYVGPKGLDATAGVVDVILIQSIQQKIA